MRWQCCQQAQQAERKTKWKKRCRGGGSRCQESEQQHEKVELHIIAYPVEERRDGDDMEEEDGSQGCQGCLGVWAIGWPAWTRWLNSVTRFLLSCRYIIAILTVMMITDGLKHISSVRGPYCHVAQLIFIQPNATAVSQVATVVTVATTSVSVLKTFQLRLA